MANESYKVVLNDHELALETGTTLLDGAINHGVEIAHSCRSGICQACLVKVTEGCIPEKAQIGLSENQKLQRLALSCQFPVCNPLLIDLNSGSARIDATVIDHTYLSQQVLRIRLKSTVDWFAGQYLTIWKNENNGRPYSIASSPEDGYLEFHVRVYSEGEISSWLGNDIQINSKLKISEPVGNCFYTSAMSEKSILLAGYGTGLAPLYGVVKSALTNGHTNSIHLAVCARKKEHFYYLSELQDLAKENDKLQLKIITGDGSESSEVYKNIKSQVLQDYKGLQDWCIFLCGAPELVKYLQKGCFLQGASLKDIHSDPFISGR